MYRIDYAVMMIAGTLALVAAAITAFLWIRHHLANDPDLLEFVERVEKGREGAPGSERKDGSGAGETDG